MAQGSNTHAKQKSRWQRFGGWRLSFALLSVLLAEALSQGGLLSGIDNFYGDLWFRLAGQKATVNTVVLVKLDDSALEKLMTKVYHLNIRVTPDTAAASIAASAGRSRLRSTRSRSF